MTAEGRGTAIDVIKGKLEYWLKREGWPAGMAQLLCQDCHQRKSADEREEIMPARHGAREIRGNIDEALAAQVETLAAKTSKSDVLDRAVVRPAYPGHLARGGNPMWRIYVMLAALAAFAASPKITDTPAWRGTGTVAPLWAVLIDRETGERSAPLPWAQCMDERGTRIKASGAASLSEHYQAGERFVCEILN